MKFYDWMGPDLKIRYDTTNEPTFLEIAEIITTKIEELQII